MTTQTENAPNPGQPAHISFTKQEFAERQLRVREELARRGLDGLLLSRIEDQHWICGLDSTGFTIFHMSRDKGRRFHEHIVDRVCELVSWMRTYEGPIGAPARSGSGTR